MSDPIADLQREQSRQNNELSAMRTMHLQLMQGVSELCGQLRVLEVQYTESLRRQTEMHEVIRDHGEKIDAIRLNQASNEYWMGLMKSINTRVLMSTLAAVLSAGAAIYVLTRV